MKKLLSLTGFFVCCLSAFSQDKTETENKVLVPYAGVLAGGCVPDPFSFIIGVQKPLKQHFIIAYDVHYWNTDYECYCDAVYSKGHFTSLTPSVKFTYNTGKKTGRGILAGIGLGYMFARDHGTEQSYVYDASTGKKTTGNEIKNGNWSFTSISPSATLGFGFRVLRFPVAINNVYYFAKDTKGWAAIAGGIGVKIGFRRISAEE
jgi:hypothetical protein